jgi:signal peptidase I
VLGHEDSATLGERAVTESGGSVAEQPGSTVAIAGDAPSDNVTSPTTEGDEGNYTRTPVSRKPLGCLIEVAETLILTIVIFWLIQSFVAQPYRVEQHSMETTLLPDQYVLVDKLTKNWDSYSRGDIVVFYPVTHQDDVCTNPLDDPSEPLPTPFIKRVIGEPGDTVELRDGDVYVNGVAVNEPYVHGERSDQESDETSWTIPQDRLFVMGDNRENSQDSRSFGPVCQNDVIGRAVLRYWPINTLGILQTPTYPPEISQHTGRPAATAAP